MLIHKNWQEDPLKWQKEMLSWYDKYDQWADKVSTELDSQYQKSNQQ